MNMKKKLIVSQYCCCLVVFLLNSSHILLARSLTNKQQQQGEVEVEFKGDVIHEISNFNLLLETNDSFDRLMGFEKCENGDNKEECLTRRVLQDAHLDYIYTQHYKPLN